MGCRRARAAGLHGGDDARGADTVRGELRLGRGRGLAVCDGDITAAIGLLIWCLVVMNVVDSVVRSLVLSSGATRMPFLLSMFGALGGLGAFGLIGLFVGPVILAVLLSLWREGLLQRDVELR